MSEPQWQQGNQPYQQHGQGPIPPQGPPAQGYPPAQPGYPPQGQPGHPPAPGGWPGQAPGPQGFPPGAQQPYGQPGHPPQQGFPPPPGPPGWPGAPGFPPQPPRQKRTGLIIGSLAGAVLLVGAIVFAAVVFWPTSDETPAGGGTATAPTAATEDYGVVVGSGATKVDIWLDFGCPPCKTFHDTNAEKLMQLSSTNRITVVYHPVNFLDRTSPDEYSTRAATAAVCAGDDGKFEAYAGFLFDNQPAEGGPGLSEEELVQAGPPVGTGDAFADCVRTVKYRDWIAEGSAAFTAGAVPTVHINGTNVMDLTTFADELAAAS
ncbi:DsbA family protein [Phytomonospora endophytica]|uniref:Protein-disulfide isomerase n=1 Tax=Phytomonospora endophytica TaxID=714109 RepID=A0A841FF56_9ACTN|nr:thioredoxin domain-containing protein [Phytomonospora endophytica]MBB6033633.1 protein-disulfide isomerase [Phytomonospora endophytica]GIG64851.1 hypothetical protein Pen01_11460 [Phytomonospora endophytica]